MIVTEENIDKLPKEEQILVKALLEDIEGANNNLSIKSKKLYIDWIDKHTERSCERTDPCPDDYGMYRILYGKEPIGIEMDIDTLDMTVCALYEFIELDANL